eukprot:TCONS_00003800-protein
MASDKVCILTDQDELSEENLEDDQNFGISFSNSTLVMENDNQDEKSPKIENQQENRFQESRREQSESMSLNESESNSSESNPSEDSSYKPTKKNRSKSNPTEDSTFAKRVKNRSKSDPSRTSISSLGSINFTGSSVISPVIESANNSTEDENRDFEIVRIPAENEMEIMKNNNDPQNEDQILENINIYKSWWKYPLIFSGLLGSQPAPREKKSKRYCSTLCFRRLLIFVLFLFLLVLKFDGLFQMSWILLESKFPFTVINNVVWELRWILTFFLCMLFMDKGGFHNFLSHVEISRKKWYENARKMRTYIGVVFVITVFAPPMFVFLDQNWLNIASLAKPDMWKKILMAVLVFLYRLIMTPSFCVLSAVLYLLGDHIRMTGKRISQQKTANDAHDLVRKMRKLITETEHSLQINIVVHMFLVFCVSFTTAMSTLERLEFTYKSNDGNNTSGGVVRVKIIDQGPAANLPITDLINLKTNFIEMKKHFEKMNKAVGPETNDSKENDGNGQQSEIKAEDLQKAYELIGDVQQRQIQLMEKLVQNNYHHKQNTTIESSLQSTPYIMNVLGSIPDSYRKVRVVLDMSMMLIEILLLYMAPLCLIVRTDYQLREVIHKAWDINISQQINKNLAITTYSMKEHLIAQIKDIKGFRVCGYRVEFFKTLIIASFGPFLAIAMRATLQHYGIK